MSPRILVAALLLSVALSAPAAAQLQPDQVLIVVNDSSDVSEAIGNYYAAARGIPHLYKLPDGTPTDETLSRSTYNSAIRDPLVEFLTVTRPELQDQIKALVLTKDVPIRIANSGGSGTQISAASVDSELTQLFTGNVGDSGQQGRILNPMFGSYKPLEEIVNPNLSYAVFRLDGYQTDIDPGSGLPADVKRIIDESLNPAATGQILLDAAAASGDGNNWMIQCADILTEMGIPHFLDTTSTFQKNHADLLGYCSWGSNDPTDPGPPYYGEIPPGSGDFYPGFFLPGSLTTTYVSTSARTFIDGNQNYGQSLIADLIDVGATAANGHVYEPYLDAVARPQFLFPHVHQGVQVGNAYYQSIRWLSWENIVICDPLMVSPLVSLLPPGFDSASPERVPAGEKFPGWIVNGEHFTSGYDMSVLVGGRKCRQIDVRTTTQFTCQVPKLPCGVHDLSIETFMGQVTAEKALIAYPAMDLTGEVDLGKVVTVSLYGEPLDAFFIFVSLGSADIPWPPYGNLLLDPATMRVFLAGLLLGDTLDLTGAVPDDPALSGVTFYMQSLVGADLAVAGKLTNSIEIAIP